MPRRQVTSQKNVKGNCFVQWGKRSVLSGRDVISPNSRFRAILIIFQKLRILQQIVESFSVFSAMHCRDQRLTRAKKKLAQADNDEQIRGVKVKEASGGGRRQVEGAQVVIGEKVQRRGGHPEAKQIKGRLGPVTGQVDVDRLVADQLCPDLPRVLPRLLVDVDVQQKISITTAAIAISLHRAATHQQVQIVRENALENFRLEQQLGGGVANELPHLKSAALDGGQREEALAGGGHGGGHHRAAAAAGRLIERPFKQVHCHGVAVHKKDRVIALLFFELGGEAAEQVLVRLWRRIISLSSVSLSGRCLRQRLAENDLRGDHFQVLGGDHRQREPAEVVEGAGGGGKRTGRGEGR